MAPIASARRATLSATISHRCGANTGHGLCGALCGCRASTTAAIFTSIRAMTPRRGSSTISHQPSTFRQTPRAMMPEAAVEVLLFPFSKYKFDDPAAGRALLLAAIFTAIERPFLPVAPMFVVRSSMPGTGKGMIVRSLVRLAFDTEPVAITWGGNSEEFEKRLAALLLQTPGVLSIDNANGMQIKGDLLESIITEGRADIRHSVTARS